jgi:hypothetical protein
VGAVVLVIGIATGVGLMLPRSHVATSGITVGQPPDSVWAVIRDLSMIPSWWKDVTGSVRLPDAEGRERWRQDTRMGPMTLEITESRPPQRMVTRIVTAPGADYGGTWTYQITAMNGGSRLTITEEGWVANPFFRFVSYVFFGVHGTMDDCLEALGSRFGQRVRPEHIS